MPWRTRADGTLEEFTPGFVDAEGQPLQAGVTYIGGRATVLSPAEVQQNVKNRVDDLLAEGKKLAPGVGAMLSQQIANGMQVEAALALVDAGAVAAPPPVNYIPTLAENLATQAANPSYTDPNRGRFTSSYTIETQTPTIERGDGMGISLGSIVGGVAKNVLGALPGGALLTAGATALLNSRRDTPPPPQSSFLPDMSNPFGSAYQAGRDLGNSISSSVGQVVGSILPGQLGTAVTQYIGGTPTQASSPLGLGAVAPVVKSTKQSRCPKGYALAIDGKCYPKSMLPKQLRKWKPEPKPVVSRADQKAIRRAAGAKHRLVKITRDAGAHASMSKPQRPGQHGAGCLCSSCRARRKK